MARLPLSTVERILRDAGAPRVSRDASRAFSLYMEKLTEALAREAGEFADHFGRKTITAKEADLARKRLK
jgi:histone H3/H4